MLHVICLTDITAYESLGLYWSDRLQHTGIRYAVSESRASWSDARDSCHQDNATLAVVTSAEVDTFLRDVCPDASETYVF